MSTTEDRRQAAIGRLKAKRDFRSHVAIYVIVNVGLVIIWAVAGGGYFWPIWPIAGWGIGLAFNAY
ncbi:MAG: 2TM domain-containing protein, partial [Acidimicrobiia bacterium]|nr:2TM domain-containing protein [Acidimicrobiia bacterium]